MVEVKKRALLDSLSERRKMFREESMRRSRRLSEESLLRKTLIKVAYQHIEKCRMVEDRIPAIGVSVGGYSRFTGKDVTVTACFCYGCYGKLIWEIVEGPLRRRLSIPWKFINGLELKLNECGLACLTVEVNTRPSYRTYSLEYNRWVSTVDFTGEEKPGNLPPHHILFKPGTVDKSFENFLNYTKEEAFLKKKNQQQLKKKLCRKHRKLSTSKSDRKHRKLSTSKSDQKHRKLSTSKIEKEENK